MSVPIKSVVHKVLERIYLICPTTKASQKTFILVFQLSVDKKSIADLHPVAFPSWTSEVNETHQRSLVHFVQLKTNSVT